MRRSLTAILSFVLIGSFGFAQTGPVVRDIVSAVLEQLGRNESKELADFGGERAVRQVFERAAQEGGETTARELAAYTDRYGLAALRAASENPGRMVQALDRLGGNLTEPAIFAAAREPSVITKLVITYGDDALKLAAEQPGVGSKIATTLGRNGIDAGLQLPTNEAIRLARYADDIASAPVSSATKDQLLKAIAKTPKVIFDEIEKHPRILYTAAGCATLIRISNDTKDELLGSPGDESHPAHPGFLERIGKMAFDKFYAPLSALLAVLGIGIAGWFGAKIWEITRSRKRG